MPEHHQLAISAFRGTLVNTTTEGRPHLGAALGTPNYYMHQFVSAKVSDWCSQLERSLSIADSQPHAAYAAITRGLASNSSGSTCRKPSRMSPAIYRHWRRPYGQDSYQLDAPFSAMDLWREAQRVGCSRLADYFSCERLRLWISAWTLSCSSRASGETVGIFSEIRVFKGPAIFREAENSPEQRFERSLKPMPANLLGSARRLPSASLGGGLPVRAG